MPALFTSEDLAPGFMGMALLIQLSNDVPNADAPNEGVIATCAEAGWEDIWEPLAAIYVRPPTVPAGPPRLALRIATRYHLYMRHPDMLVGPGGTGKHPAVAAYERLMETLWKIHNGEGDMLGLTRISADEVDSLGGGLSVSSNKRVFGPDTVMGFG